MAAPTNHWKLGLFVVAGFVMVLTTVAVLGARSLRKEVGRYVSYFNESVQGLEVGSPIKFRGVTIGTVGKIDIAPDHRHVEVSSDLGVAELSRLRLDVALGPLKPASPGKTPGSPKKLAMATDLRVQLASAGLTGVKFLQLDFFPVDANPAPMLPFPVKANYIPAASSMIKNIEDSLARVVTRMPEITDQLQSILGKVDGMLVAVAEKKLLDQVSTIIGNADRTMVDVRQKIGQVDAPRISRSLIQTLEGLDRSVSRLDGVLARVEGDRGLLASVQRASNAVADTVRDADGLGGQLEEALRSIQEAARSMRRLTDTLEKDPDMLLKGRGRGLERNR